MDGASNGDETAKQPQPPPPPPSSMTNTTTTTTSSSSSTSTTTTATMTTTTTTTTTVTNATDLYQICRLCLNTLNADEGESVFNNQVPSLPEKIYRVFGVRKQRDRCTNDRLPPADTVITTVGCSFFVYVVKIVYGGFGC